MMWTDKIRQVKIILVVTAIIIAVASLVISHILIKDLSNEEHNKMVNYYLNKIKNGQMTLEEVPAYWKEKVQALVTTIAESS